MLVNYVFGNYAQEILPQLSGKLQERTLALDKELKISASNGTLSGLLWNQFWQGSQAKIQYGSYTEENLLWKETSYSVGRRGKTLSITSKNGNLSIELGNNDNSWKEVRDKKFSTGQRGSTIETIKTTYKWTGTGKIGGELVGDGQWIENEDNDQCSWSITLQSSQNLTQGTLEKATLPSQGNNIILKGTRQSDDQELEFEFEAAQLPELVLTKQQDSLNTLKGSASVRLTPFGFRVVKQRSSH